MRILLYSRPIVISLFADQSEIPRLQRLLGGLIGKLVNVVLYITSIELNKLDNCVFHIVDVIEINFHSLIGKFIV